MKYDLADKTCTFLCSEIDSVLDTIEYHVTLEISSTLFAFIKKRITFKPGLVYTSAAGKTAAIVLSEKNLFDLSFQVV